ncbi:MAG: beta-1,6-N-acetylglucosaminyltransferase [Acidimicrobiales bacterium]
MSDGNHSFLILAHEDAQMLHRLVRRIAPLGPVYVHVDAKTDVSEWQLENLPGVFLSNRVPVYWGDWSMVEAITLLLERSLADGSNGRFTLISGSNYPIISNEEISIRARNLGILIGSRSAPNMPDGSRPESDYLRRFYRTKNPNGSWSRLKNGFMNRLVYYGRPLDWRSVAPATGMRAGEQYWSIDRAFAEYCVAQIRSSPPLIDYFKKIVCSDEKVFATLYGEYAREISLEGTTYSKWAGGANPVTLSRDDIEMALAKNQFWFARKFRASDSAILDWLDQL